MSKAEFSELYLDYLLEQISDPERRNLETHLEGCEECRSELRNLQETLFSLPLALPQSEPPARLKERILQQIGAPSTAARSVAGTFWKPWAIAASIAVLVLAGIAFRQYRAALYNTRIIATLQREVEGLRSVNRGLLNRINSLSRPGLRFAHLQGLEGFEAVSANAFVDPNQGSLLVFFHNLPELDADRRYQLWLIEQGQPPRPSAVFPSAGTVTEVDASFDQDELAVATLAASIEPAQGSLQPTGPIVAAGSLE